MRSITWFILLVAVGATSGCAATDGSRADDPNASGPIYVGALTESYDIDDDSIHIDAPRPSDKAATGWQEAFDSACNSPDGQGVCIEDVSRRSPWPG